MELNDLATTGSRHGGEFMTLVPKQRYPQAVELVTATVFAAAIAWSLHHGAAGSEDTTSYTAENRAAMGRMMDGMAIKPSGDVDRDFVAMMVPHHQGATDMAQVELRDGRNELLRRLAQEIIVTQRQEIAAMRLAVGQSPASSIRPSDEHREEPK